MTCDLCWNCYCLFIIHSRLTCVCKCFKGMPYDKTLPKWWFEVATGAKSWVIEELAVTKRGPQRGEPPAELQARGRACRKTGFSINGEESSAAHGSSMRIFMSWIQIPPKKGGCLEFSDSFSSGSWAHDSMGRPVCDGALGSRTVRRGEDCLETTYNGLFSVRSHLVEMNSPTFPLYLLW